MYPELSTNQSDGQKAQIIEYKVRLIFVKTPCEDNSEHYKITTKNNTVKSGKTKIYRHHTHTYTQFNNYE